MPRGTVEAGAFQHLQGDVPDRTETASAPPDLEVSSRSLFAYSADYNATFSDIRCDEHYEAFYNNYPEKQKLPPPLEPVSVPVAGRLGGPLGAPAGVPTISPGGMAGGGGSIGGVSGLRRIDSDASVEDLIFRESRKMRPRSSTNLQSLALLREDSVTSLASLSRVPSDVGLDDLAYRASPFMDSSHYAPPLAPARLLPHRDRKSVV